MPSRSRNVPSRGKRKPPAAHDPTAMPPAVAALLSMTTIPPPKPNQFKRRPRAERRVSIDELVNEWKSDDTWKASSYSSSPALSVLLEDASDGEGHSVSIDESGTEDGLMHARSTSSDSVPSLEADDRSVFSLGSPSTPESLRSRKSSSNLKRDRMRLRAFTEDASADHPLEAVPLPGDEDSLLLSPPGSRSSTPKPRSSFKSNLTTSLRALRKSFGAFSLHSATAPAQRTSASPSSTFSDQMLWSHPALFPRFSSEVRPAISGTPTEAQRRYLNPVPLSFEEQEAPFQQALHAPYLAEHVLDDVPHIQMQTYNRGRRKTTAKRGVSRDSSSEAGRALLTAADVRQREPRENSDFLRVVVLEMNMRREGKLESGRARIWLPPRQACMPGAEGEKVPRRWMGISAY